MVHHDNSSQLDDLVADYLTVPEILHARGVISELGPVTLLVETEDGRERELVLDLRWNRGGDNSLNLPLVHSLIRSEKLRDVGSLFVILGRGTFSAAMMFALDVERHTPVVFVGEPSGGRPNHFGDSRLLTLPETGVTVRISSLYWQYSNPRDQRAWIEPHIPTPLSAADYRAGRDVALEAILGLASVPAGPPTGSWGGHAGFTLPTSSGTVRFDGRVQGDQMITTATVAGRKVGFVMRRSDS